MQDLRWNTLWIYLTFAFICMIIWAATDAVTALLTFSAGLSVYIARHIYWLHRLHQWLKKPVLAHIPTGKGAWEDVLSALYQEYRRHSRNQNQLANALGRFRHAASALPDGVVVLNANNEIEWCNHPAEIKLGLQLSQDEHQPINYLVRHQLFLNYLQAKDYTEPIKLKSWLNQDITLELQLVDFGAQQKLLLCRDVSHNDKIDTMRRDFIANVSHELRTPLTVVSGFIETLQDMEGAIPKSTQHYFNLMQDQTTRMKVLIDDLLVLSQIETNSQAPEESTIDMAHLINLLCNDAKGLSQGKHSIQVEVDPQLNLTGALNEIQSALSNLVSNAIRYSPEGGNIHIDWKMASDQAIFSVSDQGLGIEPHHIDRLTERFYRVDRSRSRLSGGTGLGLSIVKHILTRHQAKLEIQSTIGAGSTFSAVFPSTRIVIANHK